jgi:DNA-binding transcriptional LysR family regulator
MPKPRKTTQTCSSFAETFLPRCANGFSCASASLLPNLLGEYRRRYPDIDLQFDIANTEDIQRRLTDGTLDAGLTEGLPPNCDELETVVFLRDQLVPIARPDHPRLKADSKPLSLRQLCAEPMIVREAGSGTREVIERALA